MESVLSNMHTLPLIAHNDVVVLRTDSVRRVRCRSLLRSLRGRGAGDVAVEDEEPISKSNGAER